jgi:hypothetical protein
VLFVDDRPDRLVGLRGMLADRGVRTDAVDPQELEVEQLADVHLVSVDQYLGDPWAAYLASPEGPQTAAARPLDGVAVAATIASQLAAAGTRAAICLHTAELEHLGEGVPAAHREALLAASHDLDWVFPFDGAAGAALAGRIVALAEAMAELPASWDAAAGDFGTTWLDLPTDEEWAKYAVQQVEDCRPPAHGLSSNTGGRAFVRWLAQRVLPYPAFLVDDLHAAVLLGVTPESLLTLVQAASEAVLPSRYDGPLTAFAGRRWWRAGLQDLLFRCDTDEADPPPDRAAAISEHLGVEVGPLPVARPVVGYDADGRQLAAPLDRLDAVRLQPDGWPVFADDAWSSRAAAAQDAALRSLVVHADRTQLDPPAS